MPNNQKLTCYFLLSVLTFLLVVSCGSSEEVRTIEEEPRTTDNQTAEPDTSEVFMELTIGMIDSVDNLDPLFSSNLSTMRILSLIYDGLLTLDKNGAVTNAIATDISVSEDSLTYTLTINTNIFYHDNTAFMSGIGRRVQADDIKWAFERTARANVPPHASKLLMNIAGYEEYFEDQRNVYDPDRRMIDGVAGITVENQQSVQFRLIEPDPDFQKKLASPYLFIYPREAVQEQGESLKSNPVGTGAFQFQDRTDNTIVLARNNSENSGDLLTQPRVNRINLVHHDSESQQFQDFASEEIDWIPEIGPETKLVTFSSNGELGVAYRDNYSESSSGSRVINLNFNDTRRVNMSWLQHRLSEFDPDSIDIPGEFTIHQPLSQVGSDDPGEPDSFYLVTFTDDFFARGLLTEIQQIYIEPESEFRLSEIRTPVLESAIYTTSSDSFHNPLIYPQDNPWVTFSSPIIGFHHQNIEGIENSNVAWKLFLESVRVEETSEEYQ